MQPLDFLDFEPDFSLFARLLERLDGELRLMIPMAYVEAIVRGRP